VPGTPIVVESVEVTSSPPAEGQGNAQRAPAAPMLPGEARIDLGDPGGAIGVRLVDSGDGTTVPGAAGPPDDIRRGRANAPVGLYFYFRVTEPLLKQSACVGLRATFFDDPALAGKNANVTLSYTNARSSGPADLPNTFSMAEGAVRFAGTGRWIQHVWVVEDAGFRTFMQGFADFRLAVGSKLPVVVQSVELAAGHPPVDGPKDAELLRRMTPRVLTLLRTHLARASVVEALGAETSLTEIERAAAIRVAGALSEPAALDLNARSWKLARSAGGTAADYAEALRLAELALARESSNQRYITNTLGVAQYRAGRCEEALATLRRSARSNASHPEPYPPAFDLVGLALCHEKLEQGPEALFLLRIAKLSAGDAPGGDLADFLKEAERDIPLRPEWTPMVEALVAGLQQGETLEAIEALPADALDAAGRELPRRMLRALAETGAEKLVFLRR
jgi:tetratricopeptide (TPR) repeat protein